MTLSIMGLDALPVILLSVIHRECHEKPFQLSVVMLTVTLLNVFILSVVMAQYK